MNSLKKYLTVNSIFSLISGLTMLIFSRQLNALFETTDPKVFSSLGLNLIIFAAFVYLTLTKQLNNYVLVLIICLLDALWVIGSVIILITTPFELSITGEIIIGIVAIWIAFLAYKQYSYNIKK